MKIISYMVLAYFCRVCQYLIHVRTVRPHARTREAHALIWYPRGGGGTGDDDDDDDVSIERECMHCDI